MTSQQLRPVQFAYAADFSRHLYECLSAIEFRALKALLTEEPEIGKKLSGSQNSRGLDYCGCIIYYSYEPLFHAACFLEVLRVEPRIVRSLPFLQRFRNFFKG
jgi:hypothetical protein